MESLAPARIAANMRRFAVDGIDHRNPDHVAAYLLARQSTTRPRSEQIVAILESMKTKSEVGFQLSSEFWLVPKGNLNDEEVKMLGDYIVSEEELRETGAVPVETDLSAVYIVEANCPRESLGHGIKKMSFRELLGSGGRTVCRAVGRESGQAVMAFLDTSCPFSRHIVVINRHQSTSRR